MKIKTKVFSKLVSFYYHDLCIHNFQIYTHITRQQNEKHPTKLPNRSPNRQISYVKIVNGRTSVDEMSSIDKY